ncbi:TIGR00730 family Rossman fold protein [Microvirga sp. W0021]|uniref:Cytokinin riboside 5'-monophosphate phosphoribohydrolase n=1 Tax=Hohaiivirga grylli TaxID=3133970 RepID=A0ABV0BL01_9HYPH
MKNPNSICVYCGSSAGNNPEFTQAAQYLGQKMANENIRLVYGGGKLGLMGIIATSVIENGGRVCGIIPEFLRAKEQTFEQAQEIFVVPDMHTRKRMMFERADAFVAMPGGVGTLEELIEMLTWGQLGRHHCPIVLLNINGFWEPLLELFSHMQAQGFIRPNLELSYIVANSAEEVIPKIREAIENRTK